MKTFLLSILFLTPLVFSAALWADSKYEAKKFPVKKVRLYDRGARVSRDILVKFEKVGVQKIIVTGLPGSAEQDSFQLENLPEGASLLEISSHFRTLKEVESKRVKELNKQIKAIDRKLRALRDAQNVLYRKEVRLSTYKRLAIEALGERTYHVEYDKGKTKEVLQFFQNQMEAIGQKRREHTLKIRKLYEERTEAQKNLYEVKPQNKQVLDVSLMVEVKKLQEATVALSYVTPSASWSPVYEARSGQKSLKFSMAAREQQNSGEDWNNVSLTFSTARPSLGASAPQLQNFFLRFKSVDANRQINLTTVMSKASAERTIAMNVNGLAKDESKLKRTVKKTGINVVFLGSEKASIRSGRSSAHVNVLEFKLESSLERLSVPSLNQRVFKKLVAKNTSGHPLLAGPVHIFHRGVFLGVSTLKHRAKGEEMNLSLGRDDRIKIRRESNKNRMKAFESGTFTSNKTARMSWLIEVKNEDKVKRTIKVYDNIPNAGIEGIEVALTSKCTKPDSTSKDGILTWNLTLNPGETKTLAFEYTLKIPGKMNFHIQQ